MSELITKIHLNSFVPRSYQIPVCQAFEERKYKKFLIINPRRCLSGDSHILMHDGSFKYLRDIKVGDSILSWDGSSFLKDIVKNVWTTDGKDTVRISSTGYIPVVTSEDHVFASVTSERKFPVDWKPIRDTTRGRQLLQYAGSGIGGVSDEKLASFWGYMLADGYVSGYQQPKFTNNNITILKRVEELAQNLFGYKAIWREKGNGFDLGFSNGTKGGGTFPNKIKELFRSEGLDVPKSERRLPLSLWNYDRDSILSLFSALISADGNIYCHTRIFTNEETGKSIPPSVEITLSCGLSDLYAWDIYWLLRKIGIVPHVPKKEKGSNWRIKIGKSSHVKTLLSKRVWGKEEMQQRAIELLNDRTRETSVINGCYLTSFKIEEFGSEELYDIETTGNHNFVANGYVVHNSGKDFEWWSLTIREAIQKPGLYLYCLPTFSQARSVIWEGKTNTGSNFIDEIPKELIAKIRQDTMTINLVNGSIIKLIGSDSYNNSIVGSNPRMIVFSEYAISDENAYKLAAMPILRANDGVVAIISTPRGKNHLFELYQIAQNSKDWFVQFLTIEDTGHISEHEVRREIESGEISEDLALQEYYCSFSRGQEGSYYAKYLDKMRLRGQIGSVPWEPYHKVHTAWDLGIKDPTVIIFFQVIGETVRIIDCYEAADKGMDHFANVLINKEYVYGKHFPPHDIMQRELSRGLTRREMYRELGVNFTEPVEIGIEDGIELVRRSLSKIWIDEVKCKSLIRSLENYREEFDIKRKVYRGRPLHDQFSHQSDALRYLCAALPKARDNGGAEALERRFREAVSGDSNLPKFFSDPMDY